jgi:hypothetical protein
MKATTQDKISIHTAQQHHQDIQYDIEWIYIERNIGGIEISQGFNGM